MHLVRTTHDFKSEVQRMCNLSSVIENKSRDEGIIFGELKTTVKYYRNRPISTDIFLIIDHPCGMMK